MNDDTKSIVTFILCIIFTVSLLYIMFNVDEILTFINYLKKKLI